MKEPDYEVKVGTTQPRWLTVVYGSLALALAGSLGLTFVAFLIGISMTMATEGLRGFDNNLSEFAIFACVALVMVLVGYWLARRVLTWEGNWMTDDEGLTVRRTFATQKIRWDDLGRARLVEFRNQGLRYVLDMDRRSYTLPVEAMQYASLVASIRDHLDRRGVLEEETQPLDLTPWTGVDGSYMRELETVEIGGGNTPAAIMLFFCAWFVFPALGVSSYIWEELSGEVLSTAAAVVLMCLVWGLYARFVHRVLLADKYIRSDRAGLTVRKALKTTFIRWNEIEEAWIAENAKKHPRLAVRSRRRTFTLTANLSYRLDLVASIWMHLNRFGKGDRIRVSPVVLSLFQPIPESVAEEMVWESGSVHGSVPARFELGRDFISVTAGGKSTTIPFSRPVWAQWASDPNKRPVLAVAAKRRVVIVVPIDLADPESARFTLACVRRLRTAAPPIWLGLPDELLAAANGKPNE